MAVATHNEGAVSIAAANWSDATGIVDTATLLLAAGAQDIVSDLNTASATTNGIYYLRNSGGFRGRLGTPEAGSAVIEFDATYTTGANLLWGGGVLYLDLGGTTITRADITGGTVVLSNGTVTTMNVGNGTITLMSNLAATTINQSGGSIVQRGAGGTAATTANIALGRFETQRVPATMNVRGNAFVIVDSPTANNTTATISAGTVQLIAGNLATLVLEGASRLDCTKLREPTTIGGTAFTRRGRAELIGRSNPLLTVSNETAAAADYEGMA